MPKIKDTETCIKDFRLMHGDLYDYSKVVYRNSNTKVSVIRRKHGEFWPTPHNHIKGSGCPVCGVNRSANKCRMGIDTFISKAVEKHGNRYNYSKVRYISSYTKVCIICVKHGEFLQAPGSHLRGSGCPLCGKETSVELKRSNRDIFINSSFEVHGNRYDYSKVCYVHSKKRVCIICREHGEFLQTPNIHLRGEGCAKCGIEATRGHHVFLLKEFIDGAKKRYGDRYDYSASKYINSLSKICIGCNIHGYFWQIPAVHLHVGGCPRCGDIVKGDKLRLTLIEFINRARIVHDRDKYDYSKVVYKDNATKMCIVCKKHGDFWQKPNAHLTGNGCPICYSSHGEEAIRKFFVDNSIDYVYQHKFINLVGNQGGLLKFDFYIPSKNVLIEYDGIQHYIPIRFKGMSIEKSYRNYESIKEHDHIKDMYCKDNNILLIRICYKDYKHIRDILAKELLIAAMNE